jgi:MFS family permease
MHFNRRLTVIGHFCCFAAFGAWAVSVPLHLLRVGAAADLAVYSACLSLCAALGLPLLSPLVDRQPRRRVMLGAAIVLVIGAVLRWGALVSGHLSLPVLIALDSPCALAFGTLQPALQALLASLCRPADLRHAMSELRLAEGLSRMVAPAMGGALFGAWGGPVAFLAPVLVFSLAAAVFFLIRVDERPNEQPRTLSSWWADIAAAVRMKVLIPAEMRQTVASVLVGAATVPLMGVAMPQLLHGQFSAAALGYAQAAFGVGGVVGYWLCRPRRVRRLNDRQMVVTVLLLAAACCAFMKADLAAVLTLSALLGGAMAIFQVAMQTNAVLATPEWYRGRLAALNMMLAQFGTVLGAALVGTAQQIFGTRGPFLQSALLLAGTAVWILIDRSHFGVLAASPESAEGAYERSHPGLFARSMTTKP